jgi:hypothetical protein
MLCDLLLEKYVEETVEIYTCVEKKRKVEMHGMNMLVI